MGSRGKIPNVFCWNKTRNEIRDLGEFRSVGASLGAAFFGKIKGIWGQMEGSFFKKLGVFRKGILEPNEREFWGKLREFWGKLKANFGTNEGNLGQMEGIFWEDD